ncbi:hypothetical protein [Reichenbachiella versicolor]|uniref:hypothetical protein n=1 Tax=Reichenbachiella versicolor TaxID=1821036 RepID=UPI000D6EA692|nr:hypothetical protein [Reichenbachiella versicolor]
MDKNEYLQLSKENGSSPRCPLISKCERRAMTLYYEDSSMVQYINYSKFLSAMIDEEGLDENYIKCIGESPSFVGGESSFRLSNMCPEVSLFENSQITVDTLGLAAKAVSYDKYFKTPSKSMVEESGHYSECAEYAKFSFERKSNSQTHDLFEAKPGMFGFTINLIELYRRVVKWRKRYH